MGHALRTRSAGRSVTALGFRRVDHVRFVVEGEVVRAEVTGVGHRLPRTVVVPVASAVRLVDAGVPMTVSDRTAE